MTQEKRLEGKIAVITCNLKNKSSKGFKSSTNSHISLQRECNWRPSINTPILQGVSSNNNSKLLLISLHLTKNPVNAGSKETLKARIIDAAKSNLTVVGARMNGTITDSKNTTRMNFNGTTDNSGIFSYTWKISNSRLGVFTVGVCICSWVSQSIYTNKNDL